MKNPPWAIPTFHSVHTLHSKICYDVSCDMDAVEGISTGTLSASLSSEPDLRPGRTASEVRGSILKLRTPGGALAGQNVLFPASVL
jgi:hypothetical protein